MPWQKPVSAAAKPLGCPEPSGNKQSESVFKSSVHCLSQTAMENIRQHDFVEPGGGGGGEAEVHRWVSQLVRITSLSEFL